MDPKSAFSGGRSRNDLLDAALPTVCGLCFEPIIATRILKRRRHIEMGCVTRGAADVLGGFGSWRMWWMLASNDVVRRYRRSRLGQLWLTLSMAVMIFGMGAVYSSLFGTSLADYMPHLGTGLILWGLIASSINESCS